MHPRRFEMLGLIIAMVFLLALSGIVHGEGASTNVSVITDSAKYDEANLTANESTDTAIVATEEMSLEQKGDIESVNCTKCGKSFVNSITIAVLDKNASESTSKETVETLGSNLEQSEMVNCYAVSANVSIANYTAANLSAKETASTVGSLSGKNNTTSENTSQKVKECVNCLDALNESVLVNQPPVCSITAPSTVCADSTGNTAYVTSQEGATYAWSITNGQITSAATLPEITWTAGAYPNPVTISVKVTKTYGSGVGAGVCECTNQVTIPVYQNLGSTISLSSVSVCEGSTGNKASVPYQVGATYSWEVTNGVITSGQGSYQITWSANELTGSSPSTATIKVTVGRVSGYGFPVCTGSSSVSVPVYPRPDCEITAPTSVCKGSTNNKASVPSAGSGASYLWKISNGWITAGQGTREITWTAGTSSLSTTITVEVTNSYGCTCSS